jgi:hypothetical protein
LRERLHNKKHCASTIINNCCTWAP